MHLPESRPDLGIARDADAISPSLDSRRAHTLAIVVAVAALGASAGLNLVDDPRPLDVQLSTSLHQAGDTLKDWQAQLSRGLQVSLRAVADGRELPPLAEDGATAMARAAEAPRPAAVDADNRDQPVRARR